MQIYFVTPALKRFKCVIDILLNGFGIYYYGLVEHVIECSVVMLFAIKRQIFQKFAVNLYFKILRTVTL